MRVSVCYVFPNLNLPLYEPYARRFVQSYLDHPPGQFDHQLHVIVNGAPANDRQKKMFSVLPFTFHNHNNHGKDIGAFMLAAHTVPCDLLVCLGAPVHFRRAGWLDRIVQVYLENGPGLYGCWGFHQPVPHIRTTAFWLPPQFLTEYPHPVDTPHRYNFEHGREDSILQWTRKNDYPVIMATWTRAFPDSQFTHAANGDCLLLDQHTDEMKYT
jgi:hypothetical protein